MNRQNNKQEQQAQQDLYQVAFQQWQQEQDYLALYFNHLYEQIIHNCIPDERKNNLNNLRRIQECEDEILYERQSVKKQNNKIKFIQEEVDQMGLLNREQFHLNIKSERYEKLQLKKYSRKSHNRKYYNQIGDRNLVQYLSTKKELLRNSLNQKKQKKQFRLNKSLKCKRPKEIQFVNNNQAKSNTSFQIQKQVNRFINFNKFDLISCENSLFHSGNKKFSKMHKISRNTQTKNKNPQEFQVLKSRINKLQNDIQMRIPFLVQMGVNLKRNRNFP